MELPTRILQEQINSAINACEARIECGLDVEEAFKNLQDEITEIFNGHIIYED